MANKVNLSALARTAGSNRHPDERPAAPESREAPAATTKKDRVPITLTQQPLAVRTQLMQLKVDTGKTIENLCAEALNDLFAKYGKPEIAVVKVKESKGRAA